MPIRFSDLAPALLGGTAAALGGPMAARPIRRAAQYADDARSLKAQHLQNMEEWENKFEENGRNQQALDFFMSIDESKNPHYKIAKTLATQGDLDGAKRAWSQGVIYENQSASDLMPSPEEMDVDETTLGADDSVSYRSGNKTVTRRRERPAETPDPSANIDYYTDEDASGRYVIVFDTSQNRMVKKVQIGGPNKVAAPEEPGEVSDPVYRRLLRKRALWGKNTGNAEVDAMTQQEARIELQSYRDDEVGYSMADALKSAPGAAQGGGGATPSGSAPENAASTPPGLVSAHQGAASTSAPGVEEKVVAGRRIRKVGPGKWVPVD